MLKRGGTNVRCIVPLSRTQRHMHHLKRKRKTKLEDDPKLLSCLVGRRAVVYSTFILKKKKSQYKGLLTVEG